MELVYIKEEITYCHEKSKQTQLEEVTQGLVQPQFDHLQVRYHSFASLIQCFIFLMAKLKINSLPEFQFVSCFSSSHCQEEFGSIPS